MLRLVPLLALLVACGDSAESYVWDLPPGFPEPRVPEGNPMSEAKVELGRRLFYDTRLSGNETQSCASCHVQSLAFTDGRAQSVGSTGEEHPRSSMSLANVAYSATLNWANPNIRELEPQALGPLFGETPVELGMAGRQDELVERLRGEAVYQEFFPTAFPDASDPFTVARVLDALASFQRTLVSGRSPYDAYLNGDSDAIGESAKRGEALFFSEDAECFHCHGGFNFSASLTHEGQVFETLSFQNNGLYDLDGRGLYPEPNFGLFEFSEDRRDMGSFKPPTLRNIAVTAPYMHDGSIATLEEVVQHYAAGGRNVTEGPNVGDGRLNPNKSIFVNGFELTPERQADLVAFLESLTDEAFLTDPRFANPWLDDDAR
ncbi:MAG: MbnH family di-heme enzyme [Myxococcota bacterium]